MLGGLGGPLVGLWESRGCKVLTLMVFFFPFGAWVLVRCCQEVSRSLAVAVLVLGYRLKNTLDQDWVLVGYNFMFLLY